MLFSAFLSFLGGSAFRMIWGEIAAFLSKRQDHQYELARLEAQTAADNAQHERELATLRLQSELGIKTIEAQRAAAVDVAEAGAFAQAMTWAFKPTGYPVVDIWNGCVRPAAATIVLILWCVKLYAQHGVMDDWDRELGAGVLGFFIADRSLARRGK